MAAERQVNIIVNFLAKGLETLTTQLKGLNTEMAALRGETSKTRTQISGLGKDAGDASKRLEIYNKNANNAGKESDKLNNSSKKARGGFANFGKQLVNTAAFLLRFAVVTGIFSGITFAIVGTAKAAAEFEAALRDLQAVANVNNANLERLRDTVFEVAGATTFTALEIVALQKSLARLGFTTEQVIGLTESIARFAEATGESGDEVATFVGKQMKAFQLATVDVAEAVNSYTTAINNSALSLESLATSSQYVSSISNSLGVSFKEQNALLATLSDSGLTASRAGTGLRKIFIELGAEGGSLLPVLDDLGESGITLSEAEDLVGDRAAGAVLALVEQRDSVRRLIDEQDNLNSVLLASARQNSTFNGQVRALRAAVDEVVISLGEWVTETGFVLNLIERISGKTTLRAYDLVVELGFTPEQIDTAIEGVEKLDNSVTMMLGGTPSVLDLGKAFGLTIDQITELETKSPKDFHALIDYFRAQNKLRKESQEIIDTAAKKEKEYLSLSEDLEKFEKGSDSWRSKRDEYYKSLSDRIGVVTEELTEYRNLSELGPLTKEQEKQLNIREKQISLLRQERQAVVGNYEAQDEGNKANKETIKSYESLLKLEDDVAEAIMAGDEAKRRSLVADIEKKKNLLIELGLFEDYLEYSERIRKERALAEQEELIAEAAQGYVDSAKIIAEALSEKVGIGEITPEEAKKQFQEVIKKYVNAVESLDPKTKADIQAALNEVFFDFEPTAPQKSLELFGLNEEDTSLLIDKAAELANSVNGAILDATQRRLEAEQAAVDARYSFEEDRLNSLLQAGIISQEQYERQRLRLEKERVAKTNEIERKRFNAEKANDLAQIAINTALAITKIIGDPTFAFKAALIGAVSAAQASIVAAQKFTPTKFKKGGMIEGASHEQGGVPFTVAGRAGFEAEGGEFIVNKRATEAFLPMLERINSFGNSSIPVQRQAFANGGVVPQGGGRTDDLLEQLVSQSSQRTIAYISEEQLISRNNTRITNDIRKRL